MNLVIKGHATRGEEVIEILEMLGGENVREVKGCGTELGYYIDKKGIIDFSLFNTKTSKEGCMILTIEQFLEKFPYKVGDSVYYDNNICDIIEMRWVSNLNTVSYGVYDGKIKNLATVEELKPYTTETKKDLDWHPTDYLEFVDNDEWADEVELNLGDSYEIVMKDGKIFAVKKKPQYSKTYEECCEYLMGKTNFQDFELVLTKLSITTNYEHEISPEPSHIKLINVFYKLLICRDAYWKIARDWKEKRKGKAIHYVIYSTLSGEVVRDEMPNCIANYLLDFPTAEMRDAFYENFKELIEECKELL